MERIIYILLALYGTVMLLMCFLQYYTVFKNKEKPKNKVHFYVARDKNGRLYLYFGKPERRSSYFFSPFETCNSLIADESQFKDVGLNLNDFKDIKWEDEPVEVFINMND